MTDIQKGIACIIGVTLCFASLDSMVKHLSDTYDPFFLVWARYAGQAVGALIIFAPNLKAIVATDRLALQIGRSALLFAATIMFFISVSLMPLANVTALGQTSPIIITAMAALFLSEKVGMYRWAAVCIGFVGALIIVRSGADGFSLISLMPLAGAVAFSAYSVSTRFLGSYDSPWTTFFYTATAGAVFASLAVPFFWATPELADVPALLLLSVLGAAGQGLLIFAMRFAAASIVAPFLYLQVLWAAMMGYLFFSETPDQGVMIGGGIVIGAGLFIRWRETVRRKQDAARL